MTYKDKKCKADHHVIGMGDSIPQKNRRSVGRLTRFEVTHWLRCAVVSHKPAGLSVSNPQVQCCGETLEQSSANFPYGGRNNPVAIKGPCLFLKALFQTYAVFNQLVLCNVINRLLTKTMFC